MAPYICLLKYPPIKVRSILDSLLEDIGFRNITSCIVGQSEHPSLNGIEGHFKELPYEFDLLESMILEATK